MKTLYLLRHAKATSNLDDFADIDRPLKASGISDAYLLGQELRNRGVRIDAVLTSNACRALQTATIVAREAHIPVKSIVIDDNLYLPDDDDITLSIIQKIPNKISSIMLVGHNPNLSIICSTLVRSFPLELPTCGLCAIEFNTDQWSQVSSSNSTHSFNIFPR